MEFDINLLRSIVTVTSLVAFLALAFWAWSKKRSEAFEEAAHLPFLDSGNDLGQSRGH